MARDSFSFTVFGVDPAPQGSKKYVGTRKTAAGNSIPLIVESSPKLPAWRKAVSDAVVAGMHSSGDLGQFTMPVRVEAVFYLTRPKTVDRKYPSKPPDLDKLLRGLMDGMKPCWIDDALVVEVKASKRYAANEPGVAVTVTRFP